MSAAGEPAPPLVVVRLRRRAEFLAAAKGVRWTTDAFVLQCAGRSDARQLSALGLGFTATKRLGGAVVRNRARRRLREAARRALPAAGAPGLDYVIVARPACLTCPFERLTEQLRAAVAGATAKLLRARG